MDTRRSNRSSGKQTKDVKLKGQEMRNQALLCTPPQTKYSKNVYSRKSDDYDDIYDSQESSPILLSTQEGGRGCEVIWDWRSPNRSNLHVLNNTPKAKERKSGKFKLKSISPLVNLPTKKQFRKPLNTNFIDNLQAQLADIQRRFNSNKTNNIDPPPQQKHEDVESNNCDNKIKEDDNDTVIIDEKSKQLPAHNSPDVSEFLKDDSFTDLLIQCSQVAENAISKGINKDLTHLKLHESNTQNLKPRSESPDLFMEEVLFDQMEPEVTFINNKKIVNTRSLHTPKRAVNSPKIVAISTPKKDLIEREEYINDDSFDAILSTLSDEAFVTTAGFSGMHTKQNNEIITQIESSVAKTSHKNSVDQNKESNFNIKPHKNDFKSSFSRHSSMPVSPRIIGSKYQLGNPIARHNSMPYGNDKNHKSGFGDKNEGSTESLGYQSSSPTIQCTPDEIEKKRQEALKRKEAARIRKEIERKRLEAIEKLQMKSKSNRRNCR